MTDEEDFSMDDLLTDSEDPQWSALPTNDKKELMNTVFEDEDWYDGTPVHIGGNSLPEFAEISARLSAPVNDIKKYYAVWLKSIKNMNPEETMRRGQTMSSTQETGFSGSSPPSSPPPAVQQALESSQTSGTSSQVKSALMSDMLGSVMNPSSGATPDPTGSMMGFMMLNSIMDTERRAIDSQNQLARQQFETQQGNLLRQETAARQDQMLTMQMNMMNQWFKNSQKQGDDEFGSMLKTAAMDKVADSLFGASESTAERIISKVLDPESLGAAIAGARSALGAQQHRVPAGYDVPTYNPYAQPAPAPEPPAEYMEPPQPAEKELSGFFEGPEQPPGEQPPGEQSVAEEPVAGPEPTAEEYKSHLLQSFQVMMGTQLEDDMTREALNAQIDIAVDQVMLKDSALLPQAKLDKMTEQLILIRAIRDIGMGMREATDHIKNGVEPDYVLSKIKEQLIGQPMFHKIFNDNTYEQLMGLIEPFKDTGSVIHDYNYLLDPEAAQLCREVLSKVKEE